MPRIKSILLFPLLLSLFLLLPTPALAVRSAAEAFYSEHVRECVLDGRQYALNGSPGYVTVWRAPQAEQAADYLLNERLVTVACTWQGGGETWGLLRYVSLGKGTFSQERESAAGWVRMSELVLLYTLEQFVAEHLDEFVLEEASLDMRDYDVVNLWPFPGSGGKAELATWYIRTEDDNLLTFPAYWVDSLGRRWGGYSFFDADGFICLDEPGLEDNRLPEVSIGYFVYPAADSVTLPRINAASAASPYAIAAVSGVLLLLLLILSLVWRRRRRKLQDLLFPEDL